MSRIATLAPILALGAALCACAVGPRYRAPDVPEAAAGPFLSAGKGASSRSLPPGWWRLYRDAVLDRLVQEALAANTDLRVAAANLAYAQAQLEEARGLGLPSTTLTAGAQEQRSAALVAAGRGANFLYSAGFSADYEIDLFGRVRRTIEAARNNAEAVSAAEDQVRVTVAAGVAGAYAAACGLGEQVDVARRNVAVVQQGYDLTVVQRNAGALSDFDVDRQGVLLGQAKAAVPPLEGQRRAQLFALTALLGRTPARLPEEAEACRRPPTLAQAMPVGDGAALLRRRPDIREAERSLAASVARIRVATAELYPTITLGGGVANAATGLGRLASASTATFSVGPLLSWSFPNLVGARARVRQASAQAAAALASFDGVVLAALRDTEQALSVYAAELDRHAELLAARRSAEGALALANVQFQSGAASALDVLQAETS
ncbi:MAG: efflux transporter outer membrane subunit, partial [Caulobacteraceae bacterium]|nr:efflux transporter outer membrane subunit [Caulobacteraceae bacterium]